MAAQRYLTADELRLWIDKLSLAMSPAAMSAVCEEISDITGDYVLTQPGTQFWRDAFIGAKFGGAQGYDLARLCAGERPDIELLRDGIWHEFEITEADDPERKRGKEYAAQRLSDQSIADPEEAWQKRRQAVPEALNRIVAKKMALPYSPECSLLIYLNLSTYGCWKNEILRDIQTECQPALRKFKQVWVLWDGSFIPVIKS
ncbi:hypothetical protein [Brevundimonas sp.]|uniref:hypothetical protein n=1 Tax=Brevundimonas sp. TaxID=1871086 RepID=UPI003D0C26AC